MKEPLRTRYAPGYDLFKLIVAVILTAILIFLLLQENKLLYARLGEGTNTASIPTVSPQTSFITVTPSPASTEPKPPPPTETPATVTPTPKETPTENAGAAVVETPSPEPTPSTPPVDCPSNPTRIQVGARVRVLDWLNFRKGPGLNYPIQHTNKPGTEMEVIGGPVCTPRGDDPPRAYLWWNVRMEDGREGWSAEAPLNFPNYFLEPVRGE